MKPVAVFRHAANVGPGYFTEFLDRQAVPWQLFALDEGASVPRSCAGFSALCFMGGPMSVNDPLPWIEPELALIRAAVAGEVPVIGHCLGGQLMARALGGQVTRNPVKEIGWTTVQRADNAVAQRWLGDVASVRVYQWHGETFSLPAQAELLWHNEACAHQAFAIGPHLAMQCHVEMTERLIRAWLADWQDEFACPDSLPASVQLPTAQLAELPTALAAMRRTTDQLYHHWLGGVLARAH